METRSETKKRGSGVEITKKIFKNKTKLSAFDLDYRIKINIYMYMISEC